jgi:hypothetical protein
LLKKNLQIEIDKMNTSLNSLPDSTKSLEKLEEVKGEVEPKEKLIGYAIMLGLGLLLLSIVVWIIKRFGKPKTAIMSTKDIMKMIEF